MSQSSLIPIKTRDEIEVEKLLTTIQAKRDQVAEMTLEIEELKLDIRRFESEYNARVGRFYIELDKVELLTKEHRLRLRLLKEGLSTHSPEMEKRIESCFRSERERLADYERGINSDEKTFKQSKAQLLPPDQMKQLRGLYLRLAKIYHPDKANFDDDQDERKQMMMLINRAYENLDIQTLKRINIKIGSEAESTAETVPQRRQRLTQEINRLMRAQGELRLEINRVKSSKTYQFKQEVGRASESGMDLLTSLARDLQHKINANKRRLADMIERFHQFSRKVMDNRANVL